MKDQITHLPDNADRSVAKQKFKITNWPTYNKALINLALMNVPLRCPDYTSVSKRAKSVNVSFKTSTRGEIAHLVIDSTGLKVFGEGEWKVRKHGKERRRIWRKLHLAVDSNTHEVVCADLSLNNVTDSEAFPGLIRQTHRKIRAAAADGAYDTRLCHDELRRKKISALIPPRKGAGYWPGEYADRNRAVANQRLSGSNARWKWTGQVAEAMAMVRALNRMTKAGMPESVRIA
ncbi:IS5 family transposase [Klebsiella pneumoniae]|uniref:IS5 family transposase n=1 Tax=Klebsiella pneumoniae TaxID=573 RepID=UPI0023B9299B|nr:IS5 family transposase [Klebsiella pneumoniae]MCL9934813.1 IS5 family transposase [Klebsiella pneumoniae]